MREFWYSSRELEAWVAAHGNWWPKCEDPAVWGRFAVQARCGRYTFSHRNQARLHFAETLVARRMELHGYVCWTNARIFRKPNRPLGQPYGLQTRLLEALLRETLGFVPQVEYEKEHMTNGLRLKSIDVAGFHFGRNQWVFAEVKRDGDRLHREQKAALSFLRQLFPPLRADVFLARVRLRPGA